MLSYVYVLELEDDCFYVGKSKDVEKRFSQHLSGEGAAWTALHKPLKISEVKEHKGIFDEDNKVKVLMMVYGIDKVRGGTYSMKVLPEYQILSLKAEIAHAQDVCFKCGKSGHYSGQCNTS